VKLYLVQHGEALPEEIDADRPLSDQGRQDVVRLADLLRACAIQVSCVVHSGKTRASQTAKLLAAVVSPGREVQLLQGLNPLDPVEPLFRQVAGWDQDKLVVGHMPLLGALLSRLVTGRDDADVVAFSTGTAVCLAKTEGASHWTLLWMLRPDLLRGQERSA
jgi:phosphohistidine phosphatase